MELRQRSRQHRPLARVEAALRDSEARNAAILDAALDAIITLDETGRIVEFNPAAQRIFGYSRHEAIGSDMAELIVPERLRDAHRAGLRAAARRGSQLAGRRVDMPALRADGTEFPAELTITRLQVAGQPLFTGHLRDITERREAEQRIEHLAFHDGLTGLPNRARLEQRLAEVIDSAEPEVALLYIDLDRFKLVNDSFGHTVGDEVLRTAARRMARVLRPGDMLARHGGDEFLLLACGLDGEAGVAAAAIAHRLLSALREPISIAGLEFQISATIGVSLHPEDAASADALLRHADAAMYAGKGNEAVVVYSADGVDPRGRLSLTRRLTHALDRGELELHYQPIVRLDSGAFVGAEALLRWRDPERGLVMPGEFLPIVEESRLIEPIGEWVVLELCRQARAWLDSGFAPDLTFNVSLRQLYDGRFAKTVAGALHDHGVDPRRFTAEITESATMREPECVAQALEDLHGIGLKLAIDDFGAGFSSLGRLHDMPVDVLKIDRSFLRQLPNSDVAAAVVGTIVQLADALGMATVAEGVEEDAHRRMLVARGCELAQGFLFGRPMPAAQLAAAYH